MIANFVLDPFTYVLLKRNFKRNLTRSISELTEFLGDIGLVQKLKRRNSRVKSGTEVRNTSGFGLSQFVETSKVDKPHMRTENVETAS